MAIAIDDRTAETAETAETGGEWASRLDGYVQRAGDAAVALRALDQEAVDRIVKAMTIAGLENAIDLAELAMEETQFGVLEDKVIKNYIATEFLYDYLKDKKSVGIIDEDRERAIQYVAEPIGVVLALLPITNPTSTALFKSIVAAKTRNALIMRPSARAARCAARAAELLQEAGEAAGLPPHALQVIPDPSLDVSQYLFHHPGVDFIWTTGGPKAVAAANAAGKPCLSVGSGNAPVYVHRSADVRHGGGRHSDLQDVRLLGHLPRRADVRDRRADLRRRDRRVPADGRTAADRRGDERAGARVVPRRRPDRVQTCSASPASNAGRAGRLRGRRRRQGAARAAARRPRRARGPSVHRREADAGARASCARRRSSTRSPPASWSPSTAGSATPRPSTRPTTTSSIGSRSRSAPAGSSSTRRRRSARWAASTTR